jgi:hypothetical protein
MAKCTLVVLLLLAAGASGALDTLEDIGPDGAPVTSRVIDGVTVDISTANEVMIAGTYGSTTFYLFGGVDNVHDNSPLRPTEVSLSRFISTGLGYDNVIPIVFSFDRPVMAFGLTTIDLMERYDSAVELRAFDRTGTTVDIHARTGDQGESGLDLDWLVTSPRADISWVELGGTNGFMGGYGIDDLMLIGSIPGDANYDGAVTDADYTIWADNYGATGATWGMGDFNLSGEVTEADYTIWADNYGYGMGSVPEPGCAALLMASALAMMGRRRKR